MGNFSLNKFRSINPKKDKFTVASCHVAKFRVDQVHTHILINYFTRKCNESHKIL